MENENIGEMGNDKKGTKLSCPLEQVISQKEREGIPTQEAIANQKSLKEKLKEHYEKKKQKRTDVLRNVLTPEFVNKFAVPVYLFTVASAWKIAFFDVMPEMYEGNDRVIFWQRAFSVLLLFEIMVNWFGIRYVDSSYPRHLKVKAAEKERKEREDTGYGKEVSAKDAADSSCAKLMALNNGEDKSGSNTNQETSSKDESPHKNSPSSQLILDAQKANSEMELKNQQKKNISDLIKSPPSNTENSNSKLKTSSKSNSSSSSKSKSDKNSPATTPVDKFKSPTPVVSKKNNTVTYPYWSWVPCFDCNRTRPPRCHHCPICKTCMLKRDHHCFFAGNCVGYRNHRYFYVFLLWAWVCSMYSTIHGFPYIYMFLWQDMSYIDVFVPIAILRWMLGYISFQAALCVTTLSCCLYFDMLTSTFIYAHSRLIQWGLTSFEKAYLKRTLEIKDGRKLSEKIRAVFGRNWILNLLIPMSWMYDVEEDPVEWHSIKVIKHR